MTVTLTIDGRQVTVPQGTLIVEAAKQLGIEIPVFCYHPKLEPVGMCRMCLVTVGTPTVNRATGQPRPAWKCQHCNNWHWPNSKKAAKKGAK